MSEPPIAQMMEELIPFNKLLGIRVVLVERGHAVLDLPFRPELIGDPLRVALHGGVIASLLDTTGGAAVWTEIDPMDRVSTIDLRVDYLRPGSSENLRCEGRVVRAGRHVGVSALSAFHPSAPDRFVATGTGVYAIRRAKRSEAKGE